MKLSLIRSSLLKDKYKMLKMFLGGLKMVKYKQLSRQCNQNKIKCNGYANDVTNKQLLVTCRHVSLFQ